MKDYKLAEIYKDNTIKQQSQNLLTPRSVSQQTYSFLPNEEKKEAFSVSKDAIKSGYGDLEMTKHLYDLKLKNIFEDYQKNIASLSEEKQESLQDSYFIREMSQKYLGEYASNAGISDVSGNLLDIYGNYQQNVQEINKRYGGAELSLDREYQQAQFENLSGLMAANYGIESLKIQREQEKNANALMEGLQTGFYGYKEDANGNRVQIEDDLEFINQYKDVFETEKDFQDFVDKYSYQKDQVAKTSIHDIFDKNSDYYVGEDYIPSLMTDEKVDANVKGYVDASGQRYLTVADSVHNDKKYITTEEELYSKYADYVAEGKATSEIPQEKQIISIRTKQKAKGESEQVQYMFNAGKWHRLTPEKPVTVENMVSWVSDVGKDKKIKGIDMTISSKGGLKIGSNYLRPDTSTTFDISEVQRNTPEYDILQQFKNIHGETIQPKETGKKPEYDVYGRDVYSREQSIYKNAYIQYNNKFYGYEKGKIFELNKVGG